MRDVQQGFGQYIQRKIQAGKIPAVMLFSTALGPRRAPRRAFAAFPAAAFHADRDFAAGVAFLFFRVARQSLDSAAALSVNPAAGLYAAAAQTAFAAHVA